MTRPLSLFFIAGSLLAQQTRPATPSKPSPTRQGGAPTPADYSAAAAQADKLLRRKPAEPPAKAPDITTEITRGKDYVVGDREVPLSVGALKAIQLNKPWQEAEAEPLATTQGRVLYTYGHGLPNIPCQIGYLTQIDLQPGEKLSPEIPYGLGDSDAWQVKAGAITADSVLKSFLVIKPVLAGSSTSLFIFTDRRTYKIRLISNRWQGHVEGVVFQYPEWEQEQRFRAAQLVQDKTNERLAAAKAADQHAEKVKSGDTFAPTGHPKNSDYSVRAGKGAAWMTPLSVWDDGAHTIIRLPDTARNRGLLPVLQVHTAAGPDNPNWVLSPGDLTYTVNDLFQSADLVTGADHKTLFSGRKALRVTIINHAYDPAKAGARGTR